MHKDKKQKRKINDDQSELSSIGTQRLQEKAACTTKNKFSKMLSKASSSTSTPTTSSPPTPSHRKSIEPTLTDLSQSTQSIQSTLS
ncbi:hypothetical protein RCL_jg8379.t1 [Rhizophagus clarus]|uniref:Uncharacterized protein n=1 Tax=Rhizophagus clarus TaxID=94130 RepID=A0A8H3MC36_9GLOM|nr:hypothetical protein RCL_jg8379.t1 [Rhizophagus clarus]